MAVGVFVDPVFYMIGTGDFFNCFFSTVFVRAEDSEWGSKYPIIMNDLYNGAIKKENIRDALMELKELKTQLAQFPPTDVVWDFEDRNALPPWGNDISPEITDLSNYFVTGEGEDLLGVLKDAMEASLEIEEDLIVKHI
jgi:hypothetical protein